MSETPEATIRNALELHEMSSAPGTQAHADAVAALEALASLRQRQEERDEFYQALLREQASESERDIASLRTQLQQAEQERDAEKHRADKLQKNIDSNLAAYSDWTVERKAVESQLQQAETALAEMLRCFGGLDKTEMYRKAIEQARAALAAPPPNTKE